MSTSEPDVKSRMTILLGLVPLTSDERRLRRRLVRIAIYSYEFVTVALILLFSSHWQIVLPVSLFVSLLLLVWYFVAIRRAKKQGTLVETPATRSSALQEMSARFPRIATLMAFSGAAFTFAGRYNGNVYWAAAFCFASSLGFFIWWRALR